MKALWYILFGIAVCIVVYFPVTDSDIFWHLAAAKEMVANGTFLRIDPFTDSVPGRVWINMHWLFQLISLFVYNAGSLYGLIAMKCLVFGTAALIVLRGFNGGNRPLRFALTLIAVYQIRYYLLERPVMFTVLFLVLFLYLLDRYDRERKLIYLLLLPVIQVVWTNMQGLSPIGLFITAVFAAESFIRNDRMAFRHGSAVFFFQVVAQFVNPYGAQGVVWPLALIRRIAPGVDAAYSYGVDENIPLFSLGLNGNSPLPLFIMLISLYFLYAAIQTRSLKSRGTVFVSVMALLAVIASRNITLFVFVTLYFVNGYFAKSDEIFPSVRTTKGRIVSWIVLLIIVLPIISSAKQWPAFRGLNGLSPFRFCEGGAEFLKEHRIPGVIFNADRSGGYLLFSGARKTVYMDGRFMLRSKSEFEEYLTALGSREAFDRLNAKLDFTHILLPLSPDGKNPPLLKSICNDTSFVLCHIDGGSVIYCRRGSKLPGTSIVRDKIMQNEREKWRGNSVLIKQSEMALNAFFGCCSFSFKF